MRVQSPRQLKWLYRDRIFFTEDSLNRAYMEALTKEYKSAEEAQNGYNSFMEKVFRSLYVHMSISESVFEFRESSKSYLKGEVFKYFVIGTGFGLFLSVLATYSGV